MPNSPIKQAEFTPWFVLCRWESSPAAQIVTVAAPAPPINELAIGTLTPNNGKRGTAVTVVIISTGFTSHSVLTVNGGGVTVNITQRSSTQLTATFAISSITQDNTRSMTVTNPGGASVTKTASFTIKL